MNADMLNRGTEDPRPSLSLSLFFFRRGVDPTSQITLSKRSDNVTFLLLQRKNFTF